MTKRIKLTLSLTASESLMLLTVVRFFLEKVEGKPGWSEEIQEFARKVDEEICERRPT